MIDDGAQLLAGRQASVPGAAQTGLVHVGDELLSKQVRWTAAAQSTSYPLAAEL